jgi:hypothetical protein
VNGLPETLIHIDSLWSSDRDATKDQFALQRATHGFGFDLIFQMSPL